MSQTRGRLFINSYAPLVASRAGREAAERFSLPPFIDGSVRREPDLEHPFSSISCLCRGGLFAPRLRPDDVVVYMTKKKCYGTGESHRRLTGVLRVLHLFDRHAAAAEWYRERGMAPPSNCLVPGNPPCHVSRTHRINRNDRADDDDELTRRWDLGYQGRVRKFPRFVVCEPLFIQLGWDSPIVHDEDLVAVFGKVPWTRNPGAFPLTLLQSLTRQVGIGASPSSP